MLHNQTTRNTQPLKSGPSRGCPVHTARFVAVLGLLVCLACLAAPLGTPAIPSFALAPAQSNSRQMRIFEQIWKTVNDTYIYPDFHGLDWKGKKAELEAKITASMSDLEFYFRLRKLIESLNDHHSVFLPPYVAEELFQVYFNNGQYEGVGLVTALNRQKHYVYVLQVVPGSSAEKAGIQQHDHILTIGGFPAVDHDGYSQSFLLLGPAGSDVAVTVQTPSGAQRSFGLKREKLPDVQLVDGRMLPNTGAKKIGYLLIPTFFSPDIDKRTKTALAALMTEAGGKLDGLIVDVRINSGGAIVTMNNVLNLFARGTLGRFTSRKGPRGGLIAKGEAVGNSLSVPMVILIGPDTVSAGELFAGALQNAGRAKLVGQTSAGIIEILKPYTYEDGSVMLLAEQFFLLPNGTNWEGKGLKPVLQTPGAWDEITVAQDPAISTALGLLSK